MKVAKVLAILKKGHHYLTDNYRPISLLSCFNKIFEKLIHRRLISFLDSHDVIFKYQFAFRKLHSTSFALIEITDKIKKLLDEGNLVLGIYIDLSKAFDTVDHEILLYKLAAYGIRGHANNFLRSYLTNRQQYTFINGCKSNLRHINCGVPQGSVLGPLLFLIYINDMQHAVDPNYLRLFADDTGIFLHNRHLGTLVNNSKTYFKNLKKWFACNKRTLNESKTLFYIFHTKNKHVPIELTEIEMDSTIIRRT